jgi:hypothetical protein
MMIRAKNGEVSGVVPPAFGLGDNVMHLHYHVKTADNAGFRIEKIRYVASTALVAAMSVVRIALKGDGKPLADIEALPRAKLTPVGTRSAGDKLFPALLASTGAGRLAQGTGNTSRFPRARLAAIVLDAFAAPYLRCEPNKCLAAVVTRESDTLRLVVRAGACFPERVIARTRTKPSAGVADEVEGLAAMETRPKRRFSVRRCRHAHIVAQEYGNSKWHGVAGVGPLIF